MRVQGIIVINEEFHDYNYSYYTYIVHCVNYENPCSNLYEALHGAY